jgi:hypothetical protein
MTTFPQQTAASHRARELNPDGAERLRPAHQAIKYRAASRRIDKILGEGIELSASQLHQLAQRLLIAAEKAEKAERVA